MVFPAQVSCADPGFCLPCRFFLAHSIRFIHHLTRYSINLAIAFDQQDSLFPQPPTRFTSFEDAVDRLLPYHVWQIPDEILLPKDENPEEGGFDIWSLSNPSELKEAGKAVHQLLSIRERFAKVRRREGQVSCVRRIH